MAVTVSVKDSTTHGSAAFVDSFTFSREAIAHGVSANYVRGSDILLHLIVRPQERQLILNDSRSGMWGTETAVALTSEELAGNLPIRVSLQAGEVQLKVGARDAISLPRFATIASEHAIHAPSALAHRRTDPAVAPSPAISARPTAAPPTASVETSFVPLGFGLEPGGRVAGATDYFDRAYGIRGWVFDQDRPRFPIEVQAVCNGTVLARSWALLPRPDILPDSAHPPHAGFAVAWQRFDLAALEDIARASPQVPVEIAAPALGGRLKTVCQPIPAAMALDFVRAARALAAPSDGLLQQYERIADADAFDIAWYGPKFLGDVEQDGLLHYLEFGERQNFQPNFYFEPARFVTDFQKSGSDSLFVDYCTGRLGSDLPPHFDATWYGETYPVEPATLPLADYLAHRATRNPNRHFDVAYYLKTYPDLASVPDPYEHFVCYGVFEGRQPSAAIRFSAESLATPAEFNPFLAHLAGDTGQAEGIPQVPFAERLQGSPLFDYGHYADQHAPPLAEHVDALLHFVETGDLDQLSPNSMFDPAWYLKTYLKRPPAEGPFHHYITIGEANGLAPSPLFDPEWYAKTYAVPLEGALEHYLANRASNTVAPNAFFDPIAYVEANPDIRDSNLEAFDHWYNWGIFENRTGTPLFAAEYVWRRYLNNNRALNAFRYFLDVGRTIGWQAMPSTGDASVHREIRQNCTAGPLFEELELPAEDAPAPSVTTYAFYLPQFHPIAENDAWWGTGFTEWRNLPRGVPRFSGHYQPRVPRDLGFYELDGTAHLREHAALAQSMGITGFSFYYYNFNGHRLLETPLDAFVDDDAITMPFSIIWANENWTRRWDGMEQDVLMRQDYRDEDRAALIDDLARYLAHPRYHRIAGRPVLPIYRADAIPECAAVIEQMRTAFRERHAIDPIFLMAQAFGVVDPRDYGFDAAFEFPPHKVGATLPLLNDTLEIFDDDFVGQVRGYDAVVDFALADLPTDYPLVKTAFPSWDNDARKQGNGLSFAGSTPQKFEKWVRGIADFALERPVFGEPLVFVNAWNEWCEGAYLEPDCHFGFAYLNALARGLRPPQSARPARFEKILLVGHDAFPAGAQELLINIGRVFARTFGSDIRFLLLTGGELLPRYRDLGDVYIVDENPAEDLQGHLVALHTAGFTHALVNTTVSGTLTRPLADAGIDSVSLIHELPDIIRRYAIDGAYADLCEAAKTVVFPNAFVAEAVQTAFGTPAHRRVIQPQGLYKQIVPVPDARAQLLAELNLPADARLVLNIGYLDHRKGADLFVATAQRFAGTTTHFLWVGARDSAALLDVNERVKRRGLRNLHLIDYTREVDRYLQGADAFYLSSREDPFPSVVLEALACGLPVVAFAGSGGHAALLTDPDLGETVAAFDIPAAAAALARQLAEPRRTPALQHSRRAIVRQHYDFDSYVARLAALAVPGRPTISVIVPSYNYARYMESRLGSIFDQSMPVFEIIVLDDASSDGAADTARAVARHHGRDVTVIENDRNSGNVFRQWKKGVERARGDLIWIAEADDIADPTLLERLASELQSHPQAVFAFSDSHAIDAEGATMYESYKGYYSSLGDHGLDADGTFPAQEFLRRFLGARNLVLNASAVVWRTDKLREAFAALGEEAFDFTVAGDWRLYVEGCRRGGEIVYVADPLNGHRRHDDGVTQTLAKTSHLAEIETIHRLIAGIFPDDRALPAELATHREDLRRIWEV